MWLKTNTLRLNAVNGFKQQNLRFSILKLFLLFLLVLGESVFNT